MWWTNGTRTVFPPSTLVPPVSTIPLMLHTPCSLTRRTNGEPSKKQCFFPEIGEYLLKTFFLVSEGLKNGARPPPPQSRSPKANATESIRIHDQHIATTAVFPLQPDTQPSAAPISHQYGHMETLSQNGTAVNVNTVTVTGTRFSSNAFRVQVMVKWTKTLRLA